MSNTISIASRERAYFVAIPLEFFDMQLDPYAQAAYLWLKRRYGAGHDAVWESVSKMAKNTGMSPRRFHTALEELEARRMIVGERRAGQTTRYTITDKTEWVTPAPHAEVKDATSAPHAEVPLHHVQTTSAPRADKVDTTKKIQKEDGTTSPKPLAGTSPSSSLSQELSHEEKMSMALADPDSSEARAFLAMHGHGKLVDRRPTWELQKLLRQLLGSDAKHAQVSENLNRWALEHNLEDVRCAYEQAVNRYKLEQSSGQRSNPKLRTVHFLTDILNGSYQPHPLEVTPAQQQAASARDAWLASVPPVGTQVTTRDGQTVIVEDLDPLAQWVLTDHGSFRAEDLQVRQ